MDSDTIPKHPKPRLSDAVKVLREAKREAEAGRGPKNPPGDQLFYHVAALFFLVLLPAAFTFMVPVAWTTLSRDGGVVTATVRTSLLFVVPFSTSTATGVTDASFEFAGGGWETGVNRYVKFEDKGWLVISGERGRVAAPVEPASPDGPLYRVNSFLNDPSASWTIVFTYSDTILSLLVGGILSLLPLAYLLLLMLHVKVRLAAWRARRGAVGAV